MSSDTEIELQRSLGRVEGKLDSLLEVFEASTKNAKDEHDSLSKRVGKLERVAAYGAGVAAAVVGIGSYLVGWPHGR